ncbi:MAG: hypothetical protein JWO87_134 [Phycisphaerales bacterium]|nr:hypothetical protein [Phycisphaerales bacterium]
MGALAPMGMPRGGADVQMKTARMGWRSVWGRRKDGRNYERTGSAARARRPAVPVFFFLPAARSVLARALR